MGIIGNSSLAFHSRATDQMYALRRSAEQLQQQIATGERMVRSSDDPAAAARLRTLDRAERLAAVDAGNAATLSSDLSLAGEALEGIGADLIRVRELVVWAGNGAVSPEARAGIGREIAELRTGILGRANSLDTTGKALFGGQASGPAYIAGEDGTVAYVGTAQADELSLGEGQTVTRGVTGPQFLSLATSDGATDVFAFLQNLSAALQTPGDAAPAGPALDVLDNAIDALGRTQTVVGARLAWVETAQDRQRAGAEARTAQTAEAGGVDFAATVARLQQTLTALEASQTSFARLSALSLFDAI